MKTSQNPFSLYDFLGYFVPGAIATYAFCFVWSRVDPTRGFVDIMARLGLDRPEAYLPFVLFAYLLGHVIGFVSSVTVERYAIWVYGYPSKYLLGLRSASYWHVEAPKLLRWTVRLLVGLLALPVSTLDHVLGKRLQLRELYVKPLDPLLRTVIQRKVAALLHLRAEIDNPNEYGPALLHDFFRPVYHYALENAPSHQPKFQNYVALYGFLRSLCLVAVLWFWTEVALLAGGRAAMAEAQMSVAAAWALSYILFLGFVKFYRRFSLEALMALVVVLQHPEDRDLDYSNTTLTACVSQWFGREAVFVAPPDVPPTA